MGRLARNKKKEGDGKEKEEQCEGDHEEHEKCQNICPESE